MEEDGEGEGGGRGGFGQRWRWRELHTKAAMAKGAVHKGTLGDRPRVGQAVM